MDNNKPKVGTAKYKNDWLKENRERHNLVFNPNIKKSKVKEYAEKIGISTNEYINRAIAEKMEREKPE